MRAGARIAVEATGGCTRPVCLRSEPPLIVRSTPDAVYLVGGAAGPLGGDDLALDIEVGPGAELEVRTVAASIALPGADGKRSRLEINAHISDGGHLRFIPEPSVAAAGCNHVVDVHIALAGDARVLWRDELVIGRHGELPGAWSSRLCVDRDGFPILRHGIRIGEDAPGWAGPAVLNNASCIGTLLAVGNELPAAGDSCGARSRIFHLAAGGGVLATAMTADAVELRSFLEGVFPTGRARLRGYEILMPAS